MSKSKASKLFQEVSKLVTEQVNPDTKNIDELDPLGIATHINREDKKVAIAVEKALPEVAKAISLSAFAFQNGGRLIYVGAGTSGRLGILDATECPPTFGVSPNLVQGVIAGGKKAVFKSVEGAEDNVDGAIEPLKKIKFSTKDVLCGISASKRTPFVVGAIRYANKMKAKTIFVTCNPDISLRATVIIKAVVGPEVIMGSTRMKAGTVEKMVLNMITTGAMILCGKTYGNLMVDLKLTNKKLKERAKRIFMMVTSSSYKRAEEELAKSKGDLKTAIAMYLGNIPISQAKELLRKKKED